MIHPQINTLSTGYDTLNGYIFLTLSGDENDIFFGIYATAHRHKLGPVIQKVQSVVDETKLNYERFKSLVEACRPLHLSKKYFFFMNIIEIIYLETKSYYEIIKKSVDEALSKQLTKTWNDFLIDLALTFTLAQDDCRISALQYLSNLIETLRATEPKLCNNFFIVTYDVMKFALNHPCLLGLDFGIVYGLNEKKSDPEVKVAIFWLQEAFQFIIEELRVFIPQFIDERLRIFSQFLDEEEHPKLMFAKTIFEELKLIGSHVNLNKIETTSINQIIKCGKLLFEFKTRLWRLEKPSYKSKSSFFECNDKLLLKLRKKCIEFKENGQSDAVYELNSLLEIESQGSPFFRNLEQIEKIREFQSQIYETFLILSVYLNPLFSRATQIFRAIEHWWNKNRKDLENLKSLLKIAESQRFAIESKEDKLDSVPKKTHRQRAKRKKNVKKEEAEPFNFAAASTWERSLFLLQSFRQESIESKQSDLSYLFNFQFIVKKYQEIKETENFDYFSFITLLEACYNYFNQKKIPDHPLNPKISEILDPIEGWITHLYTTFTNQKRRFQDESATRLPPFMHECFIGIQTDDFAEIREEQNDVKLNLTPPTVKKMLSFLDQIFEESKIFLAPSPSSSLTVSKPTIYKLSPYDGSSINQTLGSLEEIINQVPIYQLSDLESLRKELKLDVKILDNLFNLLNSPMDKDLFPFYIQKVIQTIYLIYQRIFTIIYKLKNNENLSNKESISKLLNNIKLKNQLNRKNKQLVLRYFNSLPKPVGVFYIFDDNHPFQKLIVESRNIGSTKSSTKKSIEIRNEAFDAINKLIELARNYFIPEIIQ